MISGGRQIILEKYKCIYLLFIYLIFIKMNVASDRTLKGRQAGGLKQAFYYSKPVTVCRNYTKTMNLSTYLMSAILIHTCRHSSLSTPPLTSSPHKAIRIHRQSEITELKLKHWAT